MKWTQLSNTSAFGPGSSLWLFPSIEKSDWARRLDWYLNLQISKSRSHETKTWTEEIQAIIAENEIELKPFKPLKKQPLMVGTQRPLPFQQVVEIPYDGDGDSWIRSCEQVWKGLDHPSVRLFLPPTVSSSDIQSASPAFREAYDFSFIEADKG